MIARLLRKRRQRKEMARLARLEFEWWEQRLAKSLASLDAYIIERQRVGK